jgi:hypothetical protein
VAPWWRKNIRELGGRKIAVWECRNRSGRTSQGKVGINIVLKEKKGRKEGNIDQI